MLTYEGKGQPPIAWSWFGDGPGWWGSTPDYVGSEPAEIGHLGRASGPTPSFATIGVPPPLPIGGVSADGQPSRTIAILIPREAPSGDPKR